MSAILCSLVPHNGCVCVYLNSFAVLRNPSLDPLRRPKSQRLGLCRRPCSSRVWRAGLPSKLHGNATNSVLPLRRPHMAMDGLWLHLAPRETPRLRDVLLSCRADRVSDGTRSGYELGRRRGRVDLLFGPTQGVATPSCRYVRLPCCRNVCDAHSRLRARLFMDARPAVEAQDCWLHGGHLGPV